MANSSYPTTVLAKETSDPYPCLDSIWTFFQKKGIKTVFISLGCSKSGIADLELAETMGCPLHVVPTSKEEREKWTEISEILKTRSRLENTSKFLFSEGAQEKWILPKNIRIQDAIPLWGKGTIVTASGEILNTEGAFEWTEELCKKMTTDTRIDIIKMSLPYELEQSTIYAMLNAGFRPGVCIIQWSKMPDEDVASALAAGHLQTVGYKLIGKFENKFLYIFTDQDWYMTCSWEDMSCPNPMVAEVLRMARISNANSRNGHAKFEQPAAPPQEISEPVSAGGETAAVSDSEGAASQS
jgi:hypothetical protein